MAVKKKTPTAPAAGLQTLKIGSRVRCTDDGIEGRIVWANGVSVKIRWDDGEQVTWRRDSLADRPIEILAGDDEQASAPAAPAVPETAESPAPEAPAEARDATPEATTAEIPAAEPDAAQTPPAAPELAQEPPAAVTPASEPTTVETPPSAAEAAPATEPTAPASEPTDAPAAGGEAAPAAAKPKRRRKKSAEPQEQKLSALDAAAKVLDETGQPMTCPEMIGAMAAKGYWTSPGGKTPAATLYSAILREIATKGEQCRFTKAGPGRFARRGA